MHSCISKHLVNTKIFFLLIKYVEIGKCVDLLRIRHCLWKKQRSLKWIIPLLDIQDYPFIYPLTCYLHSNKSDSILIVHKYPLRKMLHIPKVHDYYIYPDRREFKCFYKTSLFSISETVFKVYLPNSVSQIVPRYGKSPPFEKCVWGLVKYRTIRKGSLL